MAGALIIIKAWIQHGLISKDVLDAHKYEETKERFISVTWENCALRAWLNGAFFDAAFEDEKNYILEATLQNENNPEYESEGGNQTDDKVFCLSIQDVERYFESDEAKIAYPTAYAEAQGVYVSKSTGTSWWWLRSPGQYNDLAVNVYPSGSLDITGVTVLNHRGGVRPAIWVQP